MLQILFFFFSAWMTGPMSGVDPDQVENDAGMYWRTFYKLEKNFGESPNPLKMAQKVVIPPLCLIRSAIEHDVMCITINFT